MQPKGLSHYAIPRLTFQSHIRSFMSKSSERTTMDSPPQVATRSFQNDPRPDSPPQVATRSFQNGLKRGMAALLGDITNTVLPEKQRRTGSEKASARLAKHLARQAPRGDPSKSTPARMTNEAARKEGETPCNTLCQLMKKRPDVINCGGECINGFLERNTTFETLKAFTLHIFATAVRVDGAGILAATAEAAKYTGFSSEVIRRWAVECFHDFFGHLSNIDDVTDKELTGERQKRSIPFLLWCSYVLFSNPYR